MTDCSGQKIKFVSEEIEFIQSYSNRMTYKGINVTVPEPEAFVLLKYLLTIERTGKYASKIAKDIKTAKDLEFFLLDQGFGEKFVEYFNAMSKSWKKKLMPILRENDSELVELFETN